MGVQKNGGYRIDERDCAEGKTEKFALKGREGRREAGYKKPPASEYALVCENTLLCSVEDSDEACLKRIFDRYNDKLPEDYSGRSVAPSDVVELYDERGRRYFYRDKDAFCPVHFSPMLAKKMKK